MKSLRRASGILAVVLVAAALNVLALKEDPFAPAVFLPLAAGLLACLAWVVLTLVDHLRGLEHDVAIVRLNAVAASVLFFLICVVAYALVKRWDRSWDLTLEGRRELAKQTVQVLESLDQDVDVIVFFVDTGDSRIDLARDKTRRFLERCRQHTSHLRVEELDPQFHPERIKALGLTRVGVEGTVVVQCGARPPKVLPISDVTARLEERDFVNALINVVRDAKPTICFLTGHGERDVLNTDQKDGASLFAEYLAKEGYETTRIAIPLSDPKVPEDCDVLVIYGPRSDFDPAEIQAIDDYLGQGGRVLLMQDPWILTDPAQEARLNLPNWLKKRFGIVVGYDAVVSEVRQQVIAELLPDVGLAEEYGEYAAPDADFRGSYNQSHPITRGFDQRMVLKDACTVRLASPLPDDVVGTELLHSLPDTWAEKDLVLLSKGQAHYDEGEAQGPLSLAVAAALDTGVPVVEGGRAREGRIVVVGDTDLASNGVIEITGHHNFLMNVIAWLCEYEELIAIRPTGTTDPPIVLSKGEEQAVAWIAALGVVQVVVAAGLIVYALRGRHQ